MTLAETTVISAVRYSMRKNCFANIIIAGPTGAGKKSIAHLIAECVGGDFVDHNATIFYQDDYIKPECLTETIPFVTMDFDAISSYKSNLFINDVRRFYEKEFVCIEIPNSNLREIKYKRKINIFVGPHAIMLLNPKNKGIINNIVPYNIPEVISVYLNTDFEACMKKRYNGIHLSEAYKKALKVQIENEIAIQKEMADLVLNCE